MNTKSMIRSSVIGCMLVAALASGAVMAQSAAPDQTVPGHGRINEVNHRLDNQQNRIQNGVAKGQINAKQEARDEKHDANIAQRESADEARHNGHLTKNEKHHLNKSENRNSRHIRRQRH
ncbi:MAG: hypothetical protein ABI128_08730 [Rhodanobacter sp.]